MSGGASVFGLGEASPATLSGGELAGSAPGSGVGQKPLSCGFESICPSRRGGGAGVEHGRQMEPLQPPGPGSHSQKSSYSWGMAPSRVDLLGSKVALRTKGTPYEAVYLHSKPYLLGNGPFPTN